ncbi:MAG: nitroreductase [Parvibaculum sp.]|nr:nitroreductase [Parvibaculum sp.]
MSTNLSALELLRTRRSAKILTLDEPGPSEDQIKTIIEIGARVPDHGKLVPWRFILFRGAARAEFGEILAERYSKIESRATDGSLKIEAGRFLRAPVVVGVVSRALPHPKIPEFEQLLSAAAAAMNILHAATALGFAAVWVTEWYAYDVEIAQALRLAEHEKMIGFIYIGTRTVPNDERPRPVIEDIVVDWTRS